ncbi:MAG: hypothetical protein IJI14_03965 [Anaerolineaceae bacterium]|nr:hypothetical protein [Anaerolineaceae bacterium]
MKSQNSVFDIEKHYTGDEKSMLLYHGNACAALSYCEQRHTMGAARAAQRRLRKEIPYDYNQAPPRLYDICIRLGIIPNYITRNSGEENDMRLKIKEDIFDFLCRLPNAENMDEGMWLRTPELWAFAEKDHICKGYSRSGKDLWKEIERNKSAWCDTWVPFQDYPANVQNRASGEYLIPYSGKKAILEYHGKKRDDAYKVTFIPESIVNKTVKDMTKENDRKIRQTIIEKIDYLPFGYLSFRYNVPIYYLVKLKRKLEKQKKNQ